MKCSVVLATKDKPDLLRMTLENIFKQRPPFDMEVVVVNDSVCKKTFEICQQYGERLKYHCTNSTVYKNPSNARNIGYRIATGETLICQCDDIVHLANNTIERLVTELGEDEFLLAKTENWTYCNGQPIKYLMDYCSVDKRPAPFFFCGSIKREHLLAVGGNDEEFVEVSYEDNWFADCLIHGLGLKPRYSSDILVHHISHGYPNNSHKNINVSKRLYHAKVLRAKESGIWKSARGIQRDI